MFYSSKKDAFFTFLILGLVIVFNIVPMLDPTPISARIVILLCSLFLLWIWFGTGYKMEDGKLKIVFGPIRWSISIQDIKKVDKVKNPFAAPALSIDRIELLYGNFSIVNISPKNKKEFVENLLKINPHIELTKKIQQELLTK